MPDMVDAGHRRGWVNDKYVYRTHMPTKDVDGTMEGC